MRQDKVLSHLKVRTSIVLKLEVAHSYQSTDAMETAFSDPKPTTSLNPKRSRLSNSDDEAQLIAPKRRALDSGFHTNDSSFAEYKHLEILDRGSFGIVTLVARTDDPSKTYACKRIPLARITADVIRKEVFLIRKAHHQHVVQIIDEYQDSKKKWYCIVMSPAADGDLAEYLQNNAAQPHNAAEWEDFGAYRSRLLQWMFCLAMVVHHIHQLGIRHRDIKPENILVHGETILLTDFGTSFHSEEDTKYTSTMTRGTRYYLPPEAANDRRFGRGGDVFSLGCVFWKMAQAISTPVIGQQTFPRIDDTYSTSIMKNPNLLDELLCIKEHSALKKRIPERFRYSDDFLTRLLRLIHSMLHLNPGSRPSAKQVSASLSSILQESCSTILPSCCHPIATLPDLESLNLDPAVEASIIASTLLRVMEEHGLQGPFDASQYTIFVYLEQKLRLQHSKPCKSTDHFREYAISQKAKVDAVRMAERLISLLCTEQAWIADITDDEYTVLLKLREVLVYELGQVELREVLLRDE